LLQEKEKQRKPIFELIAAMRWMMAHPLWSSNTSLAVAANMRMHFYLDGRVI
jgi:hypothetical protein